MGKYKDSINQLEKDQEKALSIFKSVDSLFDKQSKIGRQIVLAIIAGAWTLSYSNNLFCPSKLVIWSLALAFVYLFCDLLYYLVTMWVYNNFVYADSGIALLGLKGNEKNIFKTQVKWRCIALWWTSLKLLLLIISAILILIHVITVS